MVLSPVNVSQVQPIGSFHDPCGKTWLVPSMIAILRSLPVRPRLCLEPFAGGASVSLAVTDQDLAARIHLVEKDPSISAVWNRRHRRPPKRLLHIRSLADLGRLTFTEGDALQAIATAPQDAFPFVDPPYTAGGKAAGQRLYALPAIDHARLLALLAVHQGPVVATYDDNLEIRRTATERDIAIRPARMKNTHHAEMTERRLVRNLLV